MVTTLVVLAVAVAAAGLGSAAAMATDRRPGRLQASARVSELPDDREPPAVVNLLTEGFEVTHTAAPATLLDLADDGHLQLETYGGHTICRLGVRSPTDDAPSAYERLVLERLRGRAQDGVVPAGAVAFRDRDTSDRWFREFSRGVVADAQRRGLCHERWRLRDVLLVGAAGCVTWALAGIAGAVGGTPAEPGSVLDTLRGLALVGGLALFAIAARMARSLRQLPDEAGRRAAERWLGVRAHLADSGDLDRRPAAGVVVWGPHLAYATAMGLASTATADLPLGTDEDEHAWSRVTGGWRHVRIRYPRWRPGWGLHPGRAIARGLVVSALAVGALLLVRELGQDPGPLADVVPFGLRAWAVRAWTPVLVVGSLVAAHGVMVAGAGALDLFATTEVEGRLLRQRERSLVPRSLRRTWDRWTGEVSGPSPQPGNRRYLAVDDGTRDVLTAWVATPTVFRVASEGRRVRVKVTPRLGYVRSVEPLTEVVRQHRGEAHGLGRPVDNG